MKLKKYTDLNGRLFKIIIDYTENRKFIEYLKGISRNITLKLNPLFDFF